MADAPSPPPAGSPAAPPAAKPAILQSSEFTVEEGLPYRLMRTGAIWMNKLFFSALILLAIWLVVAAVQGETVCTDSFEVADNGTSDRAAQECSVFLTPTSKYLGAMAILSFLLSLAFGALGLVVGKRVLEVAKAGEEVGAGPAGPAPEAKDDAAAPGDVPGRGP
jgi:hypothetical protein